MKVVNIMGSPGAGKSTTAAGLFFLMKSKHLDVELVTEYTKDLIYEGSDFILQDELLVFAEKYRRIRRLECVDWVITDSPLMNSVFYSSLFGGTGQDFYESVAGKFDNAYILIRRVNPYVSKGRLQAEEDANDIGQAMRRWLVTNDIPFFETDGDSEAPQRILDWLLAHSPGMTRTLLD